MGLVVHQEGLLNANQRLDKSTINSSKTPSNHRKRMELNASGEEKTNHDLNIESDTQKVSGAININRFKRIFWEVKRGRKERGQRAAKKAIENKQNKGRVPNLDWDRLGKDQWGNPSITFSPSEEQRVNMIKALDKTNHNPTRKKLVKKLGGEFSRIYSRYRRAIEIEKGNQPNYKLPLKERKYAELAAEWCIRKKVTPHQVLNYWHYHIVNFADGNMKVPPIVFLSSASNIEAVSCSIMDSDKMDWKARQTRLASSYTHGFSDVNQLDPKLRPSLEKAGYATHFYNDRYLLTIQKTAMAIANGTRLFVAGDMKDMVKWAAKNLYSHRA